MVDAVLNVTVHEGWQVVDGVANAVVGDATLGVVIGANLCRAVAGAHQCLAAAGYVVDILLMLLVVDESAQASKRALLVLGLVASLGTLNKDFLVLTGVGVVPHVAQANSRVHLVHILSSRTTGAEVIPLDFTLVNLNVEWLSLGQDCYRCRRGVNATLSLGHRHALHTMNTAFILERAIHTRSCNAEHNLFIASSGALTAARHLNLPALALTIASVHAGKVASKECRLVATCATANLDNRVLRVLGVLGYEQQLYFFLKLGKLFLVSVNLLACHGTQFLIALAGKQLFSILHVLQFFLVVVSDSEQIFKAFIFLAQFHIALLVGDNLRVGNQCLNLLKPRVKAFKAL